MVVVLNLGVAHAESVSFSPGFDRVGLASAMPHEHQAAHSLSRLKKKVSI